MSPYRAPLRLPRRAPRAPWWRVTWAQLTRGTLTRLTLAQHRRACGREARLPAARPAPSTVARVAHALAHALRFVPCEVETTAGGVTHVRCVVCGACVSCWWSGGPWPGSPQGAYAPPGRAVWVPWSGHVVRHTPRALPTPSAGKELGSWER